MTRNSWRRMQEQGVEAEAKVSAMIKAIELSSSLRAYCNISTVTEYERAITESIEKTFTADRPCFIWQEIIVVTTDRSMPFKVLV